MFESELTLPHSKSTAKFIAFLLEDKIAGAQFVKIDRRFNF